MSAEVFTLAPFSSGRRSQFEHDGFSTSYWTYGADGGTPLLLVHGFRGDHHGLEFLANALGRFKSYQLIVPDLPGFGESRETTGHTHDLRLYCDWLASFTQNLNLENFHLLGHSFGSIVCSHALAGQKVTPASLILVNPICEPPLAGTNRVAAAGAEFYYRLGANLPEKPGTALLKAGLITRITSEFMAKTRERTLRRFINHQHNLYFSTFNSRRALMEAYRVSISHHVGEVAESINTPTLTLVGSKDDLGSVSAQQNLASRIENCRMQVIPEVGHLIHYEAPVTAAAAIHAFLGEDS